MQQENSTNPLAELVACGQSVWLDSLKRSFIHNGELKRLIEEDGLRGVTSNPSIFEKAIGGSSDYDPQISQLLSAHDWDIKELYEELAIRDIRDAADLLRPVYDRTQGHDGFVSLEVSPYVARDTKATIDEARKLWKAIGRHNVMIKVPATREGVPAIRQLISEGINVNVTLLFSQIRYQEVADAFLSGLEDYIHHNGAARHDLSRISSVASFFVSRIDTLADTLIDDRIRSCQDADEKRKLSGLQGKIAIANAKLAYQSYLEIYDSDRWHRLSAQGARPQRLLWASTSTKNPKYRDVLYVEELIGPETVTTVPPKTFAAFREHGRVRPSLTEGVAEARQVLARLEEVRIHLSEITEMLTEQAIQLFSDPFDRLLGSLEKKRRAILGKKMDSFSYELPAEMNLIVGEHLKDWADTGKVRRLWEGGRDLWTGGDESRWLGWLDAPVHDRERVAELMSFAERTGKDGFDTVLLLGMGGSSLAPEVFSKVFRKRNGYPRLQIVDTTDPIQIKSIEDSIDLKRTLVVVSSKSGSTLEPNILFEYFYSRIQACLGDLSEKEIGQRFVAITDPGSSLEKLAEEHHFRRVFHGDPAIGGRYSALSDFGMVPAALAGIDLPVFLDRALLMRQSCSRWTPPKENPGVHLGVVLGVLAQHGRAEGRNKITFVSQPELAPLQLWLEQLLAESTGKQGRGMIPVTLEDLGSVEAYGADRVFVYLKRENPENPEWDQQTEKKLIELQQSGQPVIRILIRDLMNLGQEFFRWEVATAVAGSLLAIHPFDQPDVEASKVEARQLTAEFEKTGTLPREDQLFESLTGSGIRLYGDQGLLGHHAELSAYLNAIFRLFREGDYLAFLSYLPMEARIIDALEEIRLKIRDHCRVATCLQFGPRFLHSTGQAFKGGPNQGVFVVLTADEDVDLAVPAKRYSFETVIHAQALGDLKVLRERGRRAIHLHLGCDVLQAIQELHSAVKHGLHGVPSLNNQVNTEGVNREWASSRQRRAGGNE